MYSSQSKRTHRPTQASHSRAAADLQDGSTSGCADVLWVTAEPQQASWQQSCWDLSVLVGYRFDPDLTSVTSGPDFCQQQQQQQCWHLHAPHMPCRMTNIWSRCLLTGGCTRTDCRSYSRRGRLAGVGMSGLGADLNCGQRTHTAGTGRMSSCPPGWAFPSRLSTVNTFRDVDVWTGSSNF